MIIKKQKCFVNIFVMFILRKERAQKMMEKLPQHFQYKINKNEWDAS